MSDLMQFYGKALPLGFQVTMPWMGELYVAADGTEWLAQTATSPFAYTSAYASTPSAFKHPHALMNGFTSGTWDMMGATASLAYKASSTLYCTGNYTVGQLYGDATNGYNYFTTVDGGANWTKRTFPNTKAYTVGYTAGLFIGFAISSTTNAIITSTDAVTWSSLTGASQANVSQIVSDGGNNIVIFPQNGTVANSSVDGGATWASASITAPANSSGTLNNGTCTWNAGAGLFIGSAAAGGYQTSPTGATWTNRNAQATFLPYQLYFTTLMKFASDATTTVAIGNDGFFATTTDGLTWSNHGYINQISVSGAPAYFYHDGTRFVAVFASGIAFYSTNGTSWTEAHQFPIISSGFVANDRFLARFAGSAPIKSKAMLVTDITATSPLTIASLTHSAAQGQTSIYVRIK